MKLVKSSEQSKNSALFETLSKNRFILASKTAAFTEESTKITKSMPTDAGKRPGYGYLLRNNKIKNVTLSFDDIWIPDAFHLKSMRYFHKKDQILP